MSLGSRATRVRCRASNTISSFARHRYDQFVRRINGNLTIQCSNKEDWMPLIQGLSETRKAQARKPEALHLPCLVTSERLPETLSPKPSRVRMTVISQLVLQLSEVQFLRIRDI